MATSKEIVGDVTECPICTEVIVDSKVLPRIHTFCLKCLKEFWKDKKPGDQVPCPLCRTPFNIPEGGLSDLPKNCFVEKLLDVQKLSNTNQSVPTCDTDGFLDSSATILRTQHTILANNLQNPSGITISDKEIFIVQFNKPVEVQVFDYDTFDYIRNISVPTLNYAWDITFSAGILFVGENTSGKIHRVPLNSTEPMNSWSVDGSQLTMSTLKSGNILVTCFSSAKLMEYTTTGQLVREIPLQQDIAISNPLHAIEINNDRFLVSQIGNMHRVCLIDSRGQLIKSYGGAEGSGPGQLSYPYHLVAYVNRCCLVTDYFGHRIILLNEELQFVKALIPQSSGMTYPFRLCLDRNRKKLFVAEYNNSRVVVFDILNE